MTNPTQQTTDYILLVEDGPDDIDLTLEAAREANLTIPLEIAENATEALARLRQQDAYATAPPPRLVLLDLNLPGHDGREILAQIKTDPALRRIPVIVLTTSDAREDVKQAYDLHANCYITKPVDFDCWPSLIQAIEHFWFHVATLPGS